MRELSQPEVLDRRVREDWEADGAPPTSTRAPEEARRSSAPSEPPPRPCRRDAWPRDVADAMRRGKGQTDGDASSASPEGGSDQ